MMFISVIVGVLAASTVLDTNQSVVDLSRLNVSRLTSGMPLIEGAIGPLTQSDWLLMPGLAATSRAAANRTL